MTAMHPVNTWWPDLYFHLKELMETSWARVYLWKVGFYACLGHKRDQIKTCGGMQSHQCKAWECVTSNDGWWKWSVVRPSDLVEMECGQAVGPGHDDFRKSYHLRHVEQAIYW